MGIGRRCRG